MRWRNKQRGDKRYIKRFAILPVSIGEETRWLEIVYIEQVVVRGVFIDCYWEDNRFLSRSEYTHLKFGKPLSEGLRDGIANPDMNMVNKIHEDLKILWRM